MTAIEEAARRYLRAGLSVVPIKGDGSKRPTIAWAPLQESPLPEDDIARLFHHAKGIAILGGVVSGSLEVMDFDHPTVFEQWKDLVEELRPELVDRLPLVQTPGGKHLYYRCTKISGAQKLALPQSPFRTAWGDHKDVLVETKGEGGYVLAPPTTGECHRSGLGYELVSGDLEHVPHISAEDRDLFHKAAMSLHERPETYREPRANNPTGAERPGDAYILRGPAWPKILEPHNWRIAFTKGDVIHWTRPGKKNGTSATTGHTAGLHVFSSAAYPFEPDKSYTKFAAYTLLNHGGDFVAAARRLREEGYGEPVSLSRRVTDLVPNGQPPAPQAEPDTLAEEDDGLRPVTQAEAAQLWFTEPAAEVLETELDALNRAIGGGLPVGQSMVVLGYTGSGKTEFVRQLRNQVEAPVLHVDVEMGLQRLMERDLSQTTQIPAAILRKKDLSGPQEQVVKRAIARMGDSGIKILCPGGALPTDQLEAIIRAHSQPGGLVVLDSLQRLAAGAPGPDQRTQVAMFCAWANTVAQRYRVCVIMPSEQKRSLSGGQPKRGDVLTSGAESRAIEYQQDLVLGLVPGQTDDDDDIAGDASEAFERRVEVVIAKTRLGRPGFLSEDVLFRGPCWDMETAGKKDRAVERVQAVFKDDNEVLTFNAICRKAKGKRTTNRAAVDKLVEVGVLEHITSPQIGYRVVTNS